PAKLSPAPDRTRGVEAIELLREIELEGRVDEDEHSQPRDLAPERLETRIVEKQPIAFRGDHDALKAELEPAAIELLNGVGAAERMGMRRPDEASRIVAFGFFRLVVDEARGFEIGAHALR